jgi:hypothetical protein
MQNLPVEKKKIMRIQFYEGMNEAARDYSTASGWISKEKPFLGDSLLAKLGRNVAKQTGSEYNPVIMTEVAIAASDERNSSNLTELIEATRSVIDDFEIIDYDPWDDPKH